MSVDREASRSPSPPENLEEMDLTQDQVSQESEATAAPDSNGKIIPPSLNQSPQDSSTTQQQPVAIIIEQLQTNAQKISVEEETEHPEQISSLGTKINRFSTPPPRNAEDSEEEVIPASANSVLTDVITVLEPASPSAYKSNPITEIIKGAFAPFSQ